MDPLATGLLVVLIGKHTKRALELTKLDKDYVVEMKLGFSSTTGDEEGDKEAVSDYMPTMAHIKSIMESFKGEIKQTPPIYSAIKVNGQKAYELARKGKEVKLEPRKVIINTLELSEYDYPFVRFKTSVSSGTYVRSLVEDMGKKLETGAYMSDLRRTRVGNFNLSDAIVMDEITDTKINKAIITLD